MMITTAKNISIPKTARYFTNGAMSDKIRFVWFVLHGYGQLAEDFIHNFEPIASDDILIIAPEALNRFYLKSYKGKIGATWTTKIDRENEIIDYTNYLNVLYDEMINQSNLKSVEITVLGFSQGTATACRWIIRSGVKVDKLILWSGGIPPDIDLKTHREIINRLNPTLVIGDKDDFIPEFLIQQELKRIEGLKLNFNLRRFNGGHEIPKEVLLQII